ncbi:glycosyltransferase family 2 protein [Streptomyces sp. NBC_01276]|uniref:glycosyltransferase family 2 protein n=1 Tax=Streptomyces sp. NBC_01276 TaxID=2903808 RepID=UPI00352E021B
MISVIIPTHKRSDLLDLALESLRQQTFTDFEAVVINDGGRTLATSVSPWRRHFDVTLVELPTHSGVSKARNAGIACAEGDLLAFLDDDDVFLPWHLETAHKAVTSKAADFVYLGALVADQRLTALPADTTGMHTKAYDFDPRFLLVANYIHTGSVVTRNFYKDGARFNEALTHCEDWDAWLALTHGLGYRAAFVDELTAIYHQVPRSGGLVASAQLTVPSPFTIARERIQARWPSADEQVVAFRGWMTAFEDHRNQRIRGRLPIPHQMFDAVLRDLHQWFTTGREPDHRLIPGYFEAAL